MSKDSTVNYETADQVAIISLNRPDAMNASSHQLRNDIRAAINKAERNKNIRVGILTGEGRGFCAGADLKEGFGAHHATVTQHILSDHKPIIDDLINSDKPFIAALHGATAGIGIAYAMACDLIIMGEGGFMYSPFAAISLVPDGGTTWHLLKALGYRRAYQMIIEGGRLTAQECLEYGIANKICKDDDLRAEATAWAQKIATTIAPLTMRYAKKALRTAEQSSLNDTIHREAEYQHLCVQSKDAAEGISAFLQKRPAKFTGE